VAEPATGAEVLYRVVALPGATPDNFRGERNLPKNRPRPVPPDTPWLYLAGVSTWDSEAGALGITVRRPQRVARLILKVDVGIHFERNGAPGHYDVWGAPNVLYDCIDQQWEVA
jgi:hypothetical protein